MKRILNWRWLFAAVTLSARIIYSADQNAGQPAVTVLHCEHLIDTENGKLLGETTVVVDGERIKEVVDGRVSRDGATEIELKGTVLPGLIDAHTHLTFESSKTMRLDEFKWNPEDYAIRSVVYARRTLLAGFTTVRNLGDDKYGSLPLRDAIEKGIVPGPRIFTAGVPIGSTGGHADPTDGYREDLAGDPGPADGIINGPQDAWKAVREHYKHGVDLIKIMPSGGVLDESASADNAQMTEEEIKAVVEAAHDYGYTVAAHAHGAEAIRRAVLGGVDSIEHGTFMDDQDIELMKSHGTWVRADHVRGGFRGAHGEGSRVLFRNCGEEGGGSWPENRRNRRARLQSRGENCVWDGCGRLSAWRECARI